jgi:hypothetical protein
MVGRGGAKKGEWWGRWLKKEESGVKWGIEQGYTLKPDSTLGQTIKGRGG